MKFFFENTFKYTIGVFAPFKIKNISSIKILDFIPIFFEPTCIYSSIFNENFNPFKMHYELFYEQITHFIYLII